MKSAAKRMIRKLGRPITIKNAEDEGGRSVPTYEPDGVVKMISEQRGQGRTVTDSAGSDIESNLEYRAVLRDDDPDIKDVGDSYPSVLKTPSDNQYRVLESFEEDSGVTVMWVIQD